MENELFKQMKNCLDLWSNYFQSTKTFSYRITRGNFSFKRIKPIEIDLIQYQLHLNQFNETIHRFEEKLNYLLNISLIDEQILLPFSSMFYSIKQLSNSILELGITIYEVFQLEITDFYQPFF